MTLRRFAILSSVFVCFSTSAPAFARTIVVDNDFADCPQADFNSIQLAVNVAEPGDKILVCPGIYVENPPPAPAAVLITKSDLRIEAQGAPGDVILQGTSAQLAGFHLLNTKGVLVQGFTVEGFGTPGLGAGLSSARSTGSSTNRAGSDSFRRIASPGSKSEVTLIARCGVPCERGARARGSRSIRAIGRRRRRTVRGCGSSGRA